MQSILKHLRFFIERLSSRPRIGGLQISDSAFYFAVTGEGERLISLRIPPGVLLEGRIVDRTRFRELLGQFRDMVDSENRTRAVSVVVTLPAATVYTQSFNVPNVGAERLAESAALNLQMLSPIPRESAYLSWQLIAETDDHYELLGAFAEKKYVDEIKDLLSGARFYPVAIEFPGLALTRLVSRGLQASKRSLLVFYLSSDGVNLFIFRNGALYFDYFRSWQSIQGSNREISRSVFDEVVAQEMQKVINFTLSRFQEAPEQVVLIAPGFESDLKEFITNRFGLAVLPYELKEVRAEPAWYVAIGAAFRGESDRNTDAAISLAPLTSAELFYQEQLIDFIGMWRTIVGAVLAVFLILFAGTAYLLQNQQKSVLGQLGIFRDEDQRKKLVTLEESASHFNTLVATIRSVKEGGQAMSGFLDRIQAVAVAGRVVIDQISVGSFSVPVSLSARAPDYDTVLQFKQLLQSERGITEVNLPLTGISTHEDGSVAFSLSFRYTVAPPPSP